MAATNHDFTTKQEFGCKIDIKMIKTNGEILVIEIQLRSMEELIMSKKLFGAMLLIAGLFIPALLSAQEEQPPGMEAHMKHMTPGPAHAYLAKHVGKYKAKSKMWMMPGQDPMETEGETDIAMAVGGLFLQQNFSSNFMGMDMKGLGLTGYDITRGKFVSVWVDSMGSSIIYGEGSWLEEGKSFSIEGKMFDPALGKHIKYRYVNRLDENHNIFFEMYTTPEGGEEVKVLEITYTRQ